MGGTWTRPLIHFDDMGSGYLALYQTATFEGWIEVMETATDRNPSVRQLLWTFSASALDFFDLDPTIGNYQYISRYTCTCGTIL